MSSEEKTDDVGKYTWEDWWYEYAYAVVMVGVMLIGIVVIGLVNGWK